jgi:hypothetical protein
MSRSRPARRNGLRPEGPDATVGLCDLHREIVTASAIADFDCCREARRLAEIGNPGWSARISSLSRLNDSAQSIVVGVQASGVGKPWN